DPVAVITELHPGRGEIRVKAADETEWRTPKPLLALRPGDVVRVTGDGRVVVVLTGGRGTQTITRANAPFAVAAVTSEGAAESANAAGRVRRRDHRGRSPHPQPSRDTHPSAGPRLPGVHPRGHACGPAVAGRAGERRAARAGRRHRQSRRGDAPAAARAHVRPDWSGAPGGGRVCSRR